MDFPCLSTRLFRGGPFPRLYPSNSIVQPVAAAGFDRAQKGDDGVGADVNGVAQQNVPERMPLHGAA